MTENQKLLLKLIKEGNTCNDIAEKLNITNKQLSIIDLVVILEI